MLDFILDPAVGPAGVSRGLVRAVAERVRELGAELSLRKPGPGLLGDTGRVEI